MNRARSISVNHLYRQRTEDTGQINLGIRFKSNDRDHTLNHLQVFYCSQSKSKKLFPTQCWPSTNVIVTTRSCWHSKWSWTLWKSRLILKSYFIVALNEWIEEVRSGVQRSGFNDCKTLYKLWSCPDFGMVVSKSSRTWNFFFSN